MLIYNTNINLVKTRKNIKVIHIVIIMIGFLFMLAGVVHKNLWFDETYTIGLLNHSIIDLIKIASADVHPLLYYIFAKILTIITGTNIIVLRIFSVLGMLVLSILGYTHIRKDFGEKTGIIFSFLSMFLPVMLLYSNEIRMYSWSAVLVTLASIYAYRIIKKENNKRNWILFSCFSVLSAYAHYFGAIAIIFINIMLFIFSVKNKKYIKQFFVSGISQIVLYIPGIIVLFKQALRVFKGFWVTIEYPDILLDIITFNFTGVIESKNLETFILIFSSIVIIYLILNIILKRRKDSNITVCIWALIVYFGVIAFSLIISFATNIFITRYTIPMVGLYIFPISYICGVENKKIINIIIISNILVLFAINSYNFYSEIYNKDNKKLVQVINNNIQKDDIFIYKDINLGSIIAIRYPENNQYFYNENNWSIKEAYKAYSPQMEVIDDLSIIENYKGRIWIIDNESKSLYNELSKNEKIEIIKEPEYINIPYKNLNFVISIINKTN